MVAQEIRFALRLLRKNLGFAAIATLSLALGIGAVTATFSVADALVLRPLAVPRPTEVVNLNTTSPEDPFEDLSYPDFRDIRRQSRAFEGLAAHRLQLVGLAESADALPQMKMGVLVSDAFFETLEVEPVVGRAFLPEETTVPGRDAVVILSYELWEQQFRADLGVLGSTVRLNGTPFTIVGVVPKSFTGLDPIMRPALYVPLTMATVLAPGGGTRGGTFEQRDRRNLSVKGRLRPGVSPREANAELATLGANLRQAYPGTNHDRSFAARTELESRFQETPRNAVMVAALMALAALVLLIACANLANLLLSRARTRSREIAIRLAIGAGRLALLRQLLIENLVLSLCGAVAGLGLVYFFVGYFSRIQIPTDIPLVIAVQIDQRVLLCTLAASFLSVLFFGLAPAWQTLKFELVSALKSGGAAKPARQRTWGRDSLVIAQVALGLVLIVAAGLLFDGFRKLLDFNPGFRTAHLAMMEFNPDLVGYTPEQAREFYLQIVDRAAALPAARSAALCQTTPFRPLYSNLRVVPEGYQPPRGEQSVAISGNIVGGDYFRAMDVEIVHGRAFTPDDRPESRRVVIVNEEFARRFWPGQQAIGKRLSLDGPASPAAEVIGVARDGKYFHIVEPPTPHVFLPHAQNPRTRMVMLVESSGDSATLIEPLRELVRSMDPNLPVYNVRTMETYYQQGLIAPFRLVLEMVSAMALTGLTLALVGLLGLISYAVTRRTREIGVRMALGATRADVLRLVLRQGFTLSMTGIAIGLVASEAVRRGFAFGLVGLGALSPWWMAAAPVAVLLATLAACYIPARRASRINPVSALHYE
jgi:predicted permease